MKKYVILVIVLAVTCFIVGCFGHSSSGNNSPVDPVVTKVWTVGSGGDFGTLQEAINSPEVKSGASVLVYNGTYVVTTPIIINKPLIITGQSENGVIFKTAGTASDPITLFTIQTGDVTVSKMSILDCKTTNTSVESCITVSNPNTNGNIISNISIHNCTLSIVELGIFMRAANWKIENNSFIYNPDSGITNQKFYPIGICAISGNCYISGNTLNNMSSSGIYPRFIHVTATSQYWSSTEQLEGNLVISGNSAINGACYQFYNQDSWSGIPSGLNLTFSNNNIVSLNVPSTSSFIIFYGGDSNFGNILGSVTLSGNVLMNNTSSGTGGKGMIGVDASEVLAFRTSPLTLYARGNSIQNTSIFLPGFVEAPGSSNATVGYNSSAITSITINQIN